MQSDVACDDNYSTMHRWIVRPLAVIYQKFANFWKCMKFLYYMAKHHICTISLSIFTDISVSKLFEKIVGNQLQCYLESQQLLSSSQHGFRPRLSTETAPTVITNKIYNNMDQKNISLLTLCGLSKAFDSASHKILLKKWLSIDNFWFNDYLNNRTMSVRLKDVTSKEQNVNYGVP